MEKYNPYERLIMTRTHLKAHSKKAVVYRMVTDTHICPFGIKAVDLLKRKGFEVEDNWLTNRADTSIYWRRTNWRL